MDGAGYFSVALLEVLQQSLRLVELTLQKAGELLLPCGATCAGGQCANPRAGLSDQVVHASCSRRGGLSGMGQRRIDLAIGGYRAV
ncbi:hypothetical protein BHQ23_28630 [Mycobacterium gordonae]|uniref:Uncharacterized protein n=2 Tax=Mycobacterium TaxID=1763 RepID=A0A1A6BIS2_MYCGO|nr:hypothetical protein ABW17_26730 [Mycobacterium nebraskense]OBS02257.1 hypothetical protein A9W98_15820 [Mycobacterium gordonae]ODR16810.1 hypothetical protein BHQ23_28630 [Mycobacterium gordonae]ORV88041.1 hypothetical protein AWC08_22815 [Mycobacterium gordonae]ORW16485.1 hypothetical protein AWC17_14850 [Mycobacterium nebraskense]